MIQIKFTPHASFENRLKLNYICTISEQFCSILSVKPVKLSLEFTSSLHLLPCEHLALKQGSLSSVLCRIQPHLGRLTGPTDPRRQKPVKPSFLPVGLK